MFYGIVRIAHIISIIPIKVFHAIDSLMDGVSDYRNKKRVKSFRDYMRDQHFKMLR